MPGSSGCAAVSLSDAVDRLGDAPRGREVGIAQRDLDGLELGEVEADLALDDGAVRDAPGRRRALGHGLRAAARGEAADRDGALRHGIDLAVGAEQRRDEQGAALQALGVAQGVDRDVELGALAGERLERRRHHDRGDVVGVELGQTVARVDAEALQHADQALLGERRLVERVAGAVQADHQAVADQEVLAHPLEIGDVLDARFGARARAGRQHHHGQRQGRRRAAGGGRSNGRIGAGKGKAIMKRFRSIAKLIRRSRCSESRATGSASGKSLIRRNFRRIRAGRRRAGPASLAARPAALAGSGRLPAGRRAPRAIAVNSKLSQLEDGTAGCSNGIGLPAPPAQPEQGDHENRSVRPTEDHADAPRGRRARCRAGRRVRQSSHPRADPGRGRAPRRRSRPIRCCRSRRSPTRPPAAAGRGRAARPCSTGSTTSASAS